MTSENAFSSPADSVVTSYGRDLNRDFEVLSRIEELIGREVEPSELQESLDVAKFYCSQPEPTVHILAEIIQRWNMPPGCSADSPSYGHSGGRAVDSPASSSFSSWDAAQHSTDAEDDNDCCEEDGLDAVELCDQRRPPAPRAPLIPVLKMGNLREQLGGGATAAGAGALPPGIIVQGLAASSASLQAAAATSLATFRVPASSSSALDLSLLRIVLPEHCRRLLSKEEEPSTAPPGALALDAEDLRRVRGKEFSNQEARPEQPSSLLKKGQQPPGPDRHHPGSRNDQEDDNALDRDQDTRSSSSAAAAEMVPQGKTETAASKADRSPAPTPPATKSAGALTSHALSGGWWAGDEEDEDDCILLPDAWWTALEVLGPAAGVAASSPSFLLNGQGITSALPHILYDGKQLAHTAFSSVYSATIEDSKRCTRPIVVKKLDLSSDPSLLANAYAEVVTLQHLGGWEGSARLLGYGRGLSSQGGGAVEREAVVLLERCDMTLRQWRARQDDRIRCRHQPLPTANPQAAEDWSTQALRVFTQVADRVADLHIRHVAHCDVKLDNVLLSLSTEGDLAVKLCDFSESCIFDQAESAVLRESRGTEVYQCPEMLLGRPTNGCAADCWALGCLLYELLTGSLLFPGKGDCLRPILAHQMVTGLKSSRTSLSMSLVAAHSASSGWPASGSPEASTLLAALGTSMSKGDASCRGESGNPSSSSSSSSTGEKVLHLLQKILVGESKRPPVAWVAAKARAILAGP